jgi:hypothetical protein
VKMKKNDVCEKISGIFSYYARTCGKKILDAKNIVGIFSFSFHDFSGKKRKGKRCLNILKYHILTFKAENISFK